MLNFFNKKPEKKEEEEQSNSKVEDLLLDKNKKPEKAEIKEKEQVSVEKPKNKELDKITKQCLDIGMDTKNDVEKVSRAFFNSKNSLKQDAYFKLESYLESLPYEKKNELQNIAYLEFKEREEQITTMLRNGFAQFLSKGSNLDEETRKTISLIFGDIKKMPSKGHRYWYYKIYIWQKRGEELK